MTRERQPAQPFGKRLLWFVALWASGVAITGAVAYAIKLALGV